MGPQRSRRLWTGAWTVCFLERNIYILHQHSINLMNFKLPQPSCTEEDETWRRPSETILALWTSESQLIRKIWTNFSLHVSDKPYLWPGTVTNRLRTINRFSEEYCLGGRPHSKLTSQDIGFDSMDVMNDSFAHLIKVDLSFALRSSSLVRCPAYPDSKQLHESPSQGDSVFRSVSHLIETQWMSSPQAEIQSTLVGWRWGENARLILTEMTNFG